MRIDETRKHSLAGRQPRVDGSHDESGRRERDGLAVPALLAGDAREILAGRSNQLIDRLGLK
jgi:hypothetical protein